MKRKAGFHHVGVSPIVVGKVSGGSLIRCKRPPDGPLLNALIQLFLELQARPKINIDERMLDSGIEIAVGRGADVEVSGSLSR